MGREVVGVGLEEGRRRGLGLVKGGRRGVAVGRALLVPGREPVLLPPTAAQMRAAHGRRLGLLLSGQRVRGIGGRGGRGADRGLLESAEVGGRLPDLKLGVEGVAGAGAGGEEVVAGEADEAAAGDVEVGGGHLPQLELPPHLLRPHHRLPAAPVFRICITCFFCQHPHPNLCIMGGCALCEPG